MTSDETGRQEKGSRANDRVQGKLGEGLDSLEDLKRALEDALAEARRRGDLTPERAGALAREAGERARELADRAGEKLQEADLTGFQEAVADIKRRAGDVGRLFRRVAGGSGDAEERENDQPRQG